MYVSVSELISSAITYRIDWKLWNHSECGADSPRQPSRLTVLPVHIYDVLNFLRIYYEGHIVCKATFV